MILPQNNIYVYRYDYVGEYDDYLFGDWEDNITDPEENTEGSETGGSDDTGSDDSGPDDTSGTSDLENKKRRKRSSSSTGCKTNKTSTRNNSSSKATKTKLVLKRTNSASSVLGLNVLLNPEIEEYEDGLTQNNYHGFKV